MSWRRTRTGAALNCRAVRPLLQSFLDGAIGDPRAVAVADHLDGCRACGVNADAYRWLKAAVAGVARTHDPRQLERMRTFAAALVTGQRP